MASPFSGKAGRNAAIWAAGKLQELQPTLLDMIQGGATGAQDALAGARTDITGGYGNALKYLNKQYGTAGTSMNRALASLKPVQQNNMAGYDMLNNALGLGGAAGNAAATSAFQAGPGYQWQVEQATDAAQRAANKVGALYGGNTTAAVTELGSNLANQEYGNWIKNLQPYQGAANQGAQAQANVLANMAQLYANKGQAGAGIYTGQAGQLAGIQGTLADLAVANATSQANTVSNIQGQIVGVGQQGMMAGQQAAANKFGAVMGGLQLGGQLLGGAMGGGGGNFLGNIFGKGG